MGKFDLKYFNALLAVSDGFGEGMLRAIYHRVHSSDFIRKVGETFVTRVLLIGIGLVTSVIVARILGPEGRGFYAVAITIGAIGVQFGNLGLHTSNTYYVAGDRGLLPALAANTIIVSFAVGGVGTVLIWMIFQLWPQMAPVRGLLLILSLLWIPFGLAYMLLQNLLIGIQDVRTYNKIELLTKALGLGLIGVLIITGAVGVETLFLVALIVLIIGLFWALLRLRTHIFTLPLPSLTLFKETIRYGSKAYLAAFFAFLVLRVNLLMVKYILGAEEAGYYSIAATMADTVYMLPVVIGTILFPKLSAMTHDQEKWAFTRKMAVSVGVVTVVLATFAGLLAGPVVRILFGELFVPAVPAFIWLLPGIVFLSINTCYMNYFASIGMPLITVVSPGLAAIVNIAVNLKLIPWWGIVGASITSVLSYGLMLVASIIYVSYFRENPS
jgi:O-antigen/teichoic acid export membrane protein